MKSEQKTVSESASPISPSQMDIWFFAPTTVGRNTIAVVTVEAITGPDTAWAPTMAAAFARRPFPCSRTMDSSTTMASSTRRPTPSIIPIMDSTFSDLPAKYRMIAVAMMDIGMVRLTMEVVSTRRRKRKRTKTARIAPRSPSVRIPASPEVICAAWSSNTSRLIPASAGSAAISFSMSSVTAVAASTVFASALLKTLSPMAASSFRCRPKPMGGSR